MRQNIRVLMNYEGLTLRARCVSAVIFAANFTIQAPATITLLYRCHSSGATLVGITLQRMIERGRVSERADEKEVMADRRRRRRDRMYEPTERSHQRPAGRAEEINARINAM